MSTCRAPFLQERLGKSKSLCFSEPPARGLPGVEKGSLIEIVKGVFGLPDSPRGWWKELRDTLQEDSWQSLILDPAFFNLLDFSGHLIGMIIVHVDDLLLDNKRQPPSRISHLSLLRKYGVTDCKRADSNEGVLYSGKQIRTVPDDLRPGEISFATRPDGVCEDSLWTCKYDLGLEATKRGLSVQQAKSERCKV